jgi:hypothetical protein
MMSTNHRPHRPSPSWVLPLFAAVLVLAGAECAGGSLSRHTAIARSQVELVLPGRLDPAPPDTEKLASTRAVDADTNGCPRAGRSPRPAAYQRLVQTRLQAYQRVHCLFVRPRRLARRAALRRLLPDDDIPLV